MQANDQKYSKIFRFYCGLLLPHVDETKIHETDITDMIWEAFDVKHAPISEWFQIHFDGAREIHTKFIHTCTKVHTQVA